ncbi:MAG: cytochrome c biogenesis protein CcdA [Gordonibacter sp.]|nr:cytochrome c biogenesis protein CcdA [Gordonibacter sp.]
MEETLNYIATFINSNMAAAPLLALLGGILTSFTPCSLSSLPLVIAYVSSAAGDTKKSFRYSALFVAGSAITFTALGITASAVGMLIGVTGSWWYLVLGALMVLMALQIWGILEFIPSTNLIAKTNKRGYVGAFLAGILGGVFSSPCSTPILIAILSLAASQGSIFWGIALLLCYAVGHGALALVVGPSTGALRALSGDTRYVRFQKIISITLGAAVLLLGFYMFYLGF